MKRLFAMLLVLVLAISLLPMAAFAAEKTWSDYPTITKKPDGTWVGITADNVEEPLSPDAVVAYLTYVQEWESGVRHDWGKHKFTGYGSDTKYHWLQCPCGCKISMERHVDPKDAPNDYCICGYHFSDNADLVTLWIDGCPGIKDFNKNVTEYKLKAYTYKDVKEIKIATRTHDSEATVELPEDLTLKEGENKFEIKVTSENQKVTKVYTVIITKEAKK